MKALKTTGMVTAALASVALLTSPLAMADHHGDRHGGHGKPHRDFCGKFDSGQWEEKRDAMRERADQRHEDVAERLQLTDEQREIWDEMRDERRQQYQQRFAEMKERCEDSDGE